MGKGYLGLIEDIRSWLRFQQSLGMEFVSSSPGISGFLSSADTHDPARKNVPGGHFFAGRSRDGVPGSSVSAPGSDTLPGLKSKVEKCTGCDLHRYRTNVVFGEGPEDARLLVVGEAPGRQEDQEGRPFVGVSGELLTKMLRAINISRTECFITSVVKCRPPGNRTPEQHEIERCAPFLFRQIELIRPSFILALGLIAAHTLFKTDNPLTSLRGRWHRLDNARVMVTYHPAYLLRFGGMRQKNLKREAWHDLQMLEKEYVASKNA